MAQYLGSLSKGNINQSQPIPIHFTSTGLSEENSLWMLFVTEMKQTPHEFTNDIVNYLPIYIKAEVGFNSYLFIYAKAGDVLASAASGSHFNTECLIDSNSYFSIYINAGVLISEVSNINSESEATANAVGYFSTLWNFHRSFWCPKVISGRQCVNIKMKYANIYHGQYDICCLLI